MNKFYNNIQLLHFSNIKNDKCKYFKIHFCEYNKLFDIYINKSAI